MNLPQRIQDKFIAGEAPTDCWTWTAAKTPRGYGHLYDPSSRGPGGAHRIVYELLVGAIPKGKVIDHLCRNRACVNPVHMEIVSHRENILRGVGVAAFNAVKTACKHGHPFTDENTFYDRGKRQCRACLQVRNGRRKRGTA